MRYSKDKAMVAWRTFVNQGEILEDCVRPEVARSWVRCRNAGLSPWSTNFEEQNKDLLAEKRAEYPGSLRATQPVMKFIMALLNCNVSLMDGENFVFEFFTPIIGYPRTMGTFVREEMVGTGNATVVSYEKKPIRCEGFEQYRAIAQTYSGVSAPFLDAQGRYYGALNFNSPFEVLPESALDICTMGVELANELFRAFAKNKNLLSTVEFFKPILLLYENPVLLLDTQGRILTANAHMHAYCPSWEEHPYATQSLGDYLAKKTTIEDVLNGPPRKNVAFPVYFKQGKAAGEKPLNLLRSRLVELGGHPPFYVCVFKKPEKAQARLVSTATKRFVELSAAHGEQIDYIGETAAWKEVDRMVHKAAPLKVPALLLGETGTGKEVVARALHRHSGRQGEFVAVNCGALPRDLIATELFGYVGGAFTGASAEGAAGKFEFADQGTIFLDEIGEMPVDMQVTLLRVLQEQSVTKLGSNTSKALDVRVIAATNQNIEQLIEEKRFRSDLYYRLSLMEIRLPQLRQRREDIPLLIEYFNSQLSSMLDLPCTPFPQETVNALMKYSWPGNVRELRNLVERNLIMQGEGSKVGVESLPSNIANAGSSFPR
jgi:transcriptional regulator with PAS, ATPase and Fis domain